MSKIGSVSSNPTLKQFAQGAAQSAIQPVADFVAPGVEVATLTGKYKEYDEKNRFHIPQTLRGVGGRATELSFGRGDKVFNCEPHALDYPVDNLEQLEGASLENVLKEAAVAVAEVAGLAHEAKVLDLSLEAAGPGTDVTFADNTDVVDVIDGYILQVIQAAKYGSLMGVGLVFGANAWRLFKNHKMVRKAFVVGNPQAKNTATPTLDAVGNLFLAQPEVRASLMVLDQAPEGLDENIRFLMDDDILIFARRAQPTRRDPSFMKTFRLMGQWMVPGSYDRDDGRVSVAKYDWSEDVKVTNAAAVRRIRALAPQG